ncbi:hypothetical protein IAD21_00382 [Abditibacteriota bacterium]|nr:hypothetical protein IAD21_00382 [Abditibacteriota bacterium]
MPPILSMNLSLHALWTVTICALGFSSSPVVAQTPDILLPSLPICGVPLEETSLAPRKWKIPVREINRIAFSHDGKRLAVSGSRSHSELFVGIYDLASGTLLHQLRPRGIFRVQGLEFSADDRILAVGTRGDSSPQTPKLGGTTVYEVASGAEIWSVRGNVNDLALSQDGLTIASNDDELIRIRDARNGQLKRTLLDEQGQNKFNVALSPDGSIVAVSTFKWHEEKSGQGYLDCVVALWDAKSGRFLRYLIGYVSPESQLSFSLDGCFLLTDSTPMGIWRTDNWQRIPFNSNISPSRRLWGLDGVHPLAIEVPAVGGTQLVFWDEVKQGFSFWLPADGEHEIFTAWSPNGMWLASGAVADWKTRIAPEIKSPFCTLNLWRIDRIVKAQSQKKLPSPFSAQQICVLNFAYFLSVGDWRAASRLVEGVPVPQSLSRAQDLKAQKRRIVVEVMSVGQEDGKALALFRSEIVPIHALPWMDRIRLRSDVPGRSIDHSVVERVQLRRVSQGWKIVPPSDITELPPTIISYAASALAHNIEADFVGQASLIPAYANISRLEEFAVRNDGTLTFVSPEDWERLRWGNLRSKIHSFPDSRDYFLDPGDASRIGFEINEKLFGIPKKSVDQPDQTLLLFEASDGHPNYRYQGRALIVTADGKIRLLDPNQVQRLKLEP